jgi:hypothetical protein
MRLLPQRRVPNRPQAAGPAKPGPGGPGADDPDAVGLPSWLMRPAGIVAAGTAVAAAVIIGAVPALVVDGTAHGSALQPAARWRGRLVSETPLRTLATTAAVRSELVADGFDPAAVRYGVRTYRLVYRTVDAAGRPTTASGLVAMPIGAPGRLPVVSYTHGTETFRGDAPSEQPTGFEPAPAYTYASAGFVVSDPDYLGLGTGPGLQPWFDAPSETTAALDMLRASRAFASRQGHAVRREVMISGFSQGASAALGLGRALQAHADAWFRLGALAPISGAYAFRQVDLPAVLDGELIRLNPNKALGAKYTVIYTALMFVAFNRVHQIYSSPGEIFRAPYAATIERLLDGNHTGEQLFSGTPSTLAQLLTPHGLALMAHPAGGLAAELATADRVCAGWIPAAATRLYYATGDEQAVNGNTFRCQAKFAAHGARIPAVNLGTPDNQGSRHFGSNAAGTAAIVRWFLQLDRQPRPAAARA